MSESIINHFKMQLLENIHEIVFKSEADWKKALNLLSYNPSEEIINILSILNSRNEPTVVMNLENWKLYDSNACPKNEFSAIPLLNNKSKEIIEYKAWDFMDMSIDSSVQFFFPALKDSLDLNNKSHEYWKNFVFEIVSSNTFFSILKIQKDKKLLNFVESSIIWVMNPVLQAQINSLDSLNPSVVVDLSSESLLGIFTNILLILKQLPNKIQKDYVNEKNADMKADKVVDIWNRMSRTLPDRIVDAKNALLLQKPIQNDSTSSSAIHEKERNKYIDEQLQNEINGTKSEEY